MWPTCCSAVQRVENLSECLSSSSLLANISRSFSPPVARAVIDMPPAINQRSSRAEQQPLSEWTGLAALEKRVREGEVIQLSSQESPTAHHFTSFFLTTDTRKCQQPPVKLNKQNEGKLWNNLSFLLCLLPHFPTLILILSVHRDAVQSCQLIGRPDIKSNQLGPLQPVLSNAFPWCDNGLGSPDTVAAHSQSHRHAPAQNDWHVFPWWCQIWLTTLFQRSSHHFTFRSGGNWNWRGFGRIRRESEKIEK